MWLMATSSKRTYATGWITQVAALRGPVPCNWQMLTCTSTEGKYSLGQSLWSLLVLVHKVLFDPYEYSFHHKGLERGSQKKPGVTGKFGVQNEAGKRLTEFCQEKELVIANTLFQQHKRRPYTWTSTNSQYQNQIDYILCSQRWKNSI